MRYCELGEARILKRYKSDELIKPVRRGVVQSSTQTRWQTIEQVASPHMTYVREPIVTAQRS